MADLHFRKRLYTLTILTFIAFARIGLVSQAEAQSATATGTAQFAVTSPGWVLGPTTVEDQGGNYSQTLVNPAGVKATVTEGDMVTTRGGTVQVNQIFWANPYTGTCPGLSYSITLVATATRDDAGQHAGATIQWTPPLWDGLTVFALSDGKGAPGSGTESDEFSWPATGTFTDSVTISVNATEMEGGVL